MANTKLYATGGQLSKSINNKFYPTNYTVPMLGFGDFLKNNAGTIGSLVGGAAGLFLGNPMLGAQIGGSLGGAFEGETQGQKDAALKAQIEAQQKQILLQQANDGTLVAAMGGLLPSYAGGGFMQPDNITMYAEGGFHETNPNGGIPIGSRALVEQGEVRYNSKQYGDYIFSDRF